jgi:dTMP kinase
MPLEETLLGVYVIEGPDGAGKDTVMDLLAKELTDYSFFSYPDRNSPFWKYIISEFLSRHIELAPTEVFLTYLADIIKDRSKWKPKSILNRYVTSTIAYESALGMNIETAIKLASLVAPNVEKIFYLDISVDVAMKRLSQGRKELDRFEQYDFQRKVIENYHELIRRNLFGNWIVLDATKSPEYIAQQIIDELQGTKWSGVLGNKTAS